MLYVERSNQTDWIKIDFEWLPRQTCKTHRSVTKMHRCVTATHDDKHNSRK